jgi:hypothetical protein
MGLETKLFGGQVAKQNKNFLSSFWRISPDPSPLKEIKEGKFLVLHASVSSRPRCITTNPNAYVEVQSHHALRALQSFFVFKVGSSKG